MKECRTARTRLVPFAQGDAGALLGVFRDPDVRRYLLDDMLVSLDWVKQEITASTHRFADTGAGLWSIRLTDEDGIIGFVGYRAFFDPPQLQLIYGLLPAFWGQGLATEVAARICEVGFSELGFDCILAAIDTPNDASRRVLERLGFAETHRSDDDMGTTFYRRKRSI